MEILELPANTYLSTLPSDILNLLKLYYLLGYPLDNYRFIPGYFEEYNSLLDTWDTVETYMLDYNREYILSSGWLHGKYNQYLPYIKEIMSKNNNTAWHYMLVSNMDKPIKFTFYLNNTDMTIDLKIIAFIINNPSYCDREYYIFNNYSEAYYLDF